MSLSIFKHKTVLVRPPRALFTRFDRGANVGPPGAVATQLRVLKAALRLLETATEPEQWVDFADA